MTGPGNELPERTADRGRLRASQADRERAIDVLKTAFVEERLTKDGFDLRVDQALASRTYAELAAATGGLRVGPTAGRPPVAGSAVARPASTAGRTLAKAARRSGACMLAALVVVGVAAFSHGEDQMRIFVAFLSIIAAVIAVSGLLGYGVVDAWRVHRSRG
jgi:DUF1707 SHOCT-like domain